MHRPDMPFRQLGRQRWVLIAILAIALWLRMTTIGFGLPALNDPDELMFEMGALRMLRGPTLDPGWFGHPATTTMYVLALTNIASLGAAVLSGHAASARRFAELVYADPSWMILPGRYVMTGFALASIYLTWRLGYRLFGPIAGLLAAALLAVNPVHVTWSQIIRSDTMACVFMLLCLLSASSIAQRGRWRDHLAAALWLGLAVATKWPFALSFVSIIASTIFAVRGGVLDRHRGLARIVATGIAAIVVLFIASPYLLIDHATVLKNIHGEGQAHHLGATGGSLWDNARWYVGGPILTGFGAIGIMLMMAGFLPLLRNRLALTIIAPVGTAFIAMLCIEPIVWERWTLPLMPLGAIIAAAGLVAVGEAVRPRFPPGWMMASILIVAVVPLGATIRADDAMRAHDTRQQASAWARAHIPPGSTVLIEHFAFDILTEPWRFLFPMGDAGCVDVRAYLGGKIGYATIERARGGRSNIDYGTVAPARRASCRADFAILTQAERYARERDRFPAEDAAYRAMIASGRVAAILAPRAGSRGGPVVTVVDLRRR